MSILCCWQTHLRTTSSLSSSLHTCSTVDTRVTPVSEIWSVPLFDWWNVRCRVWGIFFGPLTPVWRVWVVQVPTSVQTFLLSTYTERPPWFGSTFVPKSQLKSQSRLRSPPRPDRPTRRRPEVLLEDCTLLSWPTRLLLLQRAKPSPCAEFPPFRPRRHSIMAPRVGLRRKLMLLQQVSR